MSRHPTLAVALHGHGGQPADAAAVAAHLLPDARTVGPRGPLELAGGFAWFDDAHHDLAPALAVVDDAVASSPIGGDAGEPPRTVLVGTSQGAAVALACALRPRPRPALTAVVAIAGFLPDPDLLALDRTPAPDRAAVFLWAADDDEVVPPLRVRAAAKVLSRHGLEVEVAGGPGGHEVSPLALAAAQAWLSTLR